MKKWLRKFGLLILMASFVLVGCSNQSGQNEDSVDKNRQTIVTSFYPIYAMTKEVVGETQNVLMIQSGNGIHGFEPSAQDIQAIYDSDVFIYHSDILESWARSVKESAEDSDTIMVEASSELELMRVSGLEDVDVIEGMDESTLYDPHTWLDPKLVADEVQYIASTLGELYPEYADIYQESADRFTGDAQQIIDAYQPKFANLTQKTFVTQHTAFAYLADRFGLKQLGIAGVSSEVEPSARQLAEIQDFVEQYDVQTIFTESNVSSHTAEVIADETGAQLKQLEPLESDPQNNKSYLENLEDNIHILYEALLEESQA